MRGFRYVLLAITTSSMVFIYCNRVQFGFTLICQRPENSTENPDYYLNDPLNVAWIFTSAAIGMCVGPLPLYYVYKFDTRIVYFVYSLLAVLSSGLYPLADSFGFWPVAICRFFAIGPLLTMILGGEMCSSSFFGWEWTYYVIGFGSLVTSIAFSLTYHDDLTKNKYLTEEERQQIIEGKTEKEQSKHKEPVPHSDLLTDIAIWSCLILFIAYYIGMINYQLYSPTFIKETLGYTIRETGYFSAIPNILGIIIKIGLGKLIDCDFGLSNKWRLATPLIVLEAISALSLFLAGFSDNRVASLIFLMTFASMHFFVPVICSRTIQMIGAQHAHFAMNVNMVIAGGIQIVVPMLVVLIVPDNTREQWSHLFYLITGMIVVTCALYLFGTDATPAEWTKSVDQRAEFEKKFENFPRITIKTK